MEIKKTFGHIIHELPPQKDNPRNSEGAFATLQNGEIIFVYSKFKGNDFADCAAADICLLRSKDKGKSFEDEGCILRCDDEDAVNIMSLSLMAMNNGDIGIFYLVRATYSLMRMYLRRSNDGGRSFGERVLCTPQEGFFVVNNDRVVRLINGDIIIPAAIHRKGYCDNPNETGNGYFDSRSDVMYFISHDDGKTFLPSKNKCVMSDTLYCHSGLQEPGVIELQDGILWSWARTDLGRQYEMFSLDGGNSFTCAQPSRFTSPNSPLSMKRGNNGNIYAIWNPIPLYNGKSADVNGVWTGGRCPLVIALSCDNGKTFSEPYPIETDENGGYCYCAMHFFEDNLLLAYCAGGKDDGACLTRTRIKCINISELNELQ